MWDYSGSFGVVTKNDGKPRLINSRYQLWG